MKALVYEGPKSVVYRDVDTPQLGPDLQLIRIEAVGICGSDMHAYLGHDERRPAPLILGHEAAGLVIEGSLAGQRVTINPLVSCGVCPACVAQRENICPAREIISMPPREGAFAQYVQMPEQNLVEVPKEYPLSKAALVEPLAVSWHTAKLALEALHPSMEKKALIIGGGAIGVAAALALQAQGVRDVTLTEPNAERRDFIAQHVRATITAQTQDFFPIIIDAVGISASRQLASKHVEAGGVIAHVGLGDNREGLDMRRFTLQEISFIGTYTYTAQDFRDTAQALFEGRLGDLEWIEKRPLSGGAQAFDDLFHNRVAAPKIVLNPWE